MKGNGNKPRRAVVRVLLCRVGEKPTTYGLMRGGNDELQAMRSLVGGYIECTELDDGVNVWSNKEALLCEMPINRTVPAAPRPAPTLFGEPVDIIYAAPGLARPGEPGIWVFRGDFFMSRVNDRTGEITDVTPADIEKYTRLFGTENPELARTWQEQRTRMSR